MEEYISLVFVVSPVIRFLCKSERKWNKKWKHAGRVITYFLLTLLILFNVSKKEKNCFQLLNVTPFSSFDVIRKSFKTVAFNLHPDRNLSKTAMAEYTTLTEKYKYISSPENHYKYTRFFDLVRKEERAFHDMTILDLVTVSMLKSLGTIISTFFILAINGENVLWHPLLVYQIFMMFFDLYLRLSDELFFTTKIPFIKYYVTFEVLMIFNEFKAYFIHHSTLYPDYSLLSVSVGANVLLNNLKILGDYDSLLRQLRLKFGIKPSTSTSSTHKKLSSFIDQFSNVNKKIEKVYKKTFSLPWSPNSKKEYEKLGKYGDKISSERSNMFSFILTTAIIMMNFKK